MLKRRLIPSLLSCLFCILAAGLLAAQSPAPVVNGVTNFCRLDPNFASGGATTPEAFATLKEQGFKTVINLRTASEPGSDIPGETAAAAKAGLKYVSLPFSTAAPDVAVVDKFLEVVKDAANQPIYIHCQAGTRANAFWMIKRVLVDGWTTEKALAEADTLKMTNQALRKFALAYVEDHK
jgi:uncharacterized protein (TIGR01244 family)